MRLLLINANTSASITERVAGAARAAASPGTEIVPVTGTFGARVISTRSEGAIAMHSALDLAAKHAGGCDAVVIAVSLDTGLAALRELLPIPVVGMTEAACLVACTQGTRFGVVTLGTRTIPLYEELVVGYGLERRLAGVRAMDIGTHEYDQMERIDRGVAELAEELVAKNGAESIVLAGAAIAGRDAALAATLGVPVLDATRCAVHFAELLVRLAPAKPTRGSYARPGARELINVDTQLIEIFSGHRAR